MKYITIAATLLLVGLKPTYGQKLIRIIYVKDNIVMNSPGEANSLLAIRSVNSLYEISEYHINGPLKKVRTYKDVQHTMLEGKYLDYDNNGNLQLAGYYVNNQKTGQWFYFKKTDSLVKTESYPGPGVFNEAGNAMDSIVAPTFKGGRREWKNYLHTSVNPDAMNNLLKDDAVQISFEVSRSGALKNFVLLKSEYFVADNEMIRVCSQSPKWNPAVYGGKPIEYRFTQQLVPLDLARKN